jgi:hypothetical protein
MGAWGPGVYENDHALDLYGIVTDGLKASIDETLKLTPVAWDDIEGPLVYVHLLGVLGRDHAISALFQTTVKAWKQRYLEIFDEELADEKPRRDVIVKTFDALIAQLPAAPEAPVKPKPAAKKKPAKKKK